MALGGDGSQGEYYGEMVGSGAKGTAKAVQTLNKAQWTRRTFQATNTIITIKVICINPT